MDNKERFNDPLQAIHEALDSRQAEINTAGPGLVQSFNPLKMTCVVQPTIQARVTQQDNTVKAVNLPLLVDCPVILPAGGGCCLTMPIAAGDEVLVVFAQRCIDSWWQSGKVGPQLEFRMHDLSDGFVVAGVKSQPNVITNYNATCAEFRDIAGDTLIRIDPAAKAMTIIAATLNIQGPAGGDCAVALTGAITATGEGTFNGGHTVSQHDHGNVQNGDGVTAKPTG